MISQRLIRVLLFGSGEFALPAVEALSEPPFTLAGIVTQPDRPGGRGQKALPTPVKQAAKKLKVPFFEPEKPDEILEEITSLKPDIIVVVDYGRIVPRSIIDFGPIINLHPSLLPKYRGSTPIQTALLRGDPITGLTMIHLDEKLDHGGIISQIEVPILDDTYVSLNTKITQLISPILKDDLPRFLAGELSPIPQKESEATLTEKLTKKDGKIDWNKPAEEILRQIRALNPWPGTFTTWSGKQLKILEAEISKKRLSVGEVDPSELIIGTGKGSLKILRLQLESKKPMKTKEFLSGNNTILGAKLR